MNDNESTIQRAKAMGASACSVGFRLKEDMVLVCKFCGTQLLERSKGDTATNQIFGKCSCGWHCCSQAQGTFHEMHLVWQSKSLSSEVSNV